MPNTEELTQELFDLMYPKGFWLQGYTEPYEAPLEEIAAGLLERYTLTPKGASDD